MYCSRRVCALHPLLERGISFALRHDRGVSGGDEPDENVVDGGGHGGGAAGGGERGARLHNRRGRRGEKDAAEDPLDHRQSDGTINRRKGVASTISSNVSTGDYEIKFKQEVDGCAYSATFDHNNEFIFISLRDSSIGPREVA